MRQLDVLITKRAAFYLPCTVGNWRNVKKGDTAMVLPNVSLAALLSAKMSVTAATYCMLLIPTDASAPAVLSALPQIEGEMP